MSEPRAMSIYANLFTYRPRPSRKPLEDFLSEALADLLNRLTYAEHMAFVTDVLLEGEARRDWSAFMEGRHRSLLRWATQVSIRSGQGTVFMDLLLRVGDHEVLVVESKVHAGYQMHGSDGPPAEAGPRGGEVNQMKTYGRWLGEQCRTRVPDAGQPWPGALVLLTHRTDPPAGFEAGRYGVGHVGVCRWRQVQRWAEALPTKAGDADRSDGSVPVLAAELAKFLDEQGMGADLMTADRLSGAAMHFVEAEKVRRAVDAMQERLGHSLLEVQAGRVWRADFAPRDGIVWAWSWLNEPRGAKWYFGWGVRYPELTRKWERHEPPLPSVPHLFLAFVSEGKDLPRAALASITLPDGWVAVGPNQLMVGTPLEDFVQDGDSAAERMGDWVAEHIRDFRTTLEALVQAAA